MIFLYLIISFIIDGILGIFLHIRIVLHYDEIFFDTLYRESYNAGIGEELNKIINKALAASKPRVKQ